MLNDPYFLVALPHLEDHYFSRAVILVMQHDDKGAFGLMINKEISYDEDEDFSDLDEEAQDQKVQLLAQLQDQSGEILDEYKEDVYLGGPVDEEKLFVLHTAPELAVEEMKVGDSLFLSTHSDTFEPLLENQVYLNKKRFFLGASVWSYGQLESELRSGDWLHIPYSERYLLNKESLTLTGPWGDHLWKQLLSDSGLNPWSILPSARNDLGYN